MHSVDLACSINQQSCMHTVRKSLCNHELPPTTVAGGPIAAIYSRMHICNQMCDDAANAGWGISIPNALGHMRCTGLAGPWYQPGCDSVMLCKMLGIRVLVSQ